MAKNNKPEEEIKEEDVSKHETINEYVPEIGGYIRYSSEEWYPCHSG